jgi:hypothetical protein
MHMTAFLTWLLPFVFAAPWLVGSIVLWRRCADDGYLPPSGADLARQRLWIN